MKPNLAYISRLEGGRVHLHAYRSCEGWLRVRDVRSDMLDILPDKTCLLYWFSGVRAVALCPACYRMLTDGGKFV